MVKHRNEEFIGWIGRSFQHQRLTEVWVLSAFNLSMLGKQSWKFITEPDPLVACIFKAHYFPNGSFLTATVGHNSIYVWRSTMRARFLVRGGARWSRGSGANISILNESSYNWRPGYWSGIWNLKVPPKVKNLIWRMCRGCLLTCVCLLDKGVTCPTNCANCDSNHEDLMPVFFACSFAIQVWNRCITTVHIWLFNFIILPTIMMRL